VINYHQFAAHEVLAVALQVDLAPDSNYWKTSIDHQRRTQAPKNPAWYDNLVANPQAEIEIDTQTARVTEGTERGGAARTGRCAASR
jgi:F420H(2)-dependent quinone reductase